MVFLFRASLLVTCDYFTWRLNPKMMDSAEHGHKAPGVCFHKHPIRCSHHYLECHCHSASRFFILRAYDCPRQEDFWDDSKFQDLKIRPFSEESSAPYPWIEWERFQTSWIMMLGCWNSHQNTLPSNKPIGSADARCYPTGHPLKKQNLPAPVAFIRSCGCTWM